LSVVVRWRVGLPELSLFADDEEESSVGLASETRERVAMVEGFWYW